MRFHCAHLARDRCQELHSGEVPIPAILETVLLYQDQKPSLGITGGETYGRGESPHFPLYCMLVKDQTATNRLELSYSFKESDPDQGINTWVEYRPQMDGST